MGLVEDLEPGPVGLDSVIFIYFIERHPDFLSLVRPVFRAIDGGRIEGVTSALTLLETLVVPYRRRDGALARRYEELLTRSRGLRLIDLGAPVLLSAAKIRAVAESVKTPDALQLSAAVSAGCTSFLSNDRRLPELPGLHVLQLSDYR